MKKFKAFIALDATNNKKNIEVVKTICKILDELVPLKKSSLKISNYEKLQGKYLNQTL